MSAGSLDTAHLLLAQAFDALDAIAEIGCRRRTRRASDRVRERGARLDQATVDAVAALERRGMFSERGYNSQPAPLADLLGWERFEARRRVIAAEHVTARVGLDGSPLPARLPATAAVFADGRASLRHVEVIARVLDTPSARRLTPEQWAGAESALAARPATTPRRSCRPGVPRWSRRSIRTAPSPTTGRRRRSTSCT